MSTASHAIAHAQYSRALSKQHGRGTKHKSAAAAAHAQARKRNFLARNAISISEQKSRSRLICEWKQLFELMSYHYERLHFIAPYKKDFDVREMRIQQLTGIHISLINKDMPVFGTSCGVCLGSGFFLSEETTEKCPACPPDRVEYPMESDEYLESLPENKVCRICAGREGKYLLSPCGHGLLCELCVATQDADNHDPACPFCRKRPVAPLQLRIL